MNINDHAPFAPYVASVERYTSMQYRRCGNSGIMLPALSLGLWHNFGQYDNYANCRELVRAAFDCGITHFDLANNYGPPYGSAEETFSRLLKDDIGAYRDELLISTKAGYDMWPGPYGNGGSKKYLMASLEQSLKRMNVEYVDIFYHHRPDPTTPLEETVHALDLMVKQGKALYIGLSNYDAEQTRQAQQLFKQLNTPCIIEQSRMSMFEREPEEALLPTLDSVGMGMIAFSPLAQGMLTDKYLHGIPASSRASNQLSYFKHEQLEQRLPQIHALNQLAQERGQTLAQMALVWLLSHPTITSVLIGASSAKQLKENVRALENADFDSDTLNYIDNILRP